MACRSLAGAGDVLEGTDAHPDTGNAAFNMFLQNCGSRIGAVLIWVLLVNIFFAGVATITVSARITFALVRDGAIPLSGFFQKLHPVLESPVRVLCLQFAASSALLLLPLIPGNADTAYSAIIGLSSVCISFSCLVPVLLKCYYMPVDFPDTDMSLGRWSRPLGVVTIAFLAVASFVFFLPFESPVTFGNMNWNVAVVAGVVLLAGVHWRAWASKHFRGPAMHTVEKEIELSRSSSRRKLSGSTSRESASVTNPSSLRDICRAYENLRSDDLND